MTPAPQHPPGRPGRPSTLDTLLAAARSTPERRVHAFVATWEGVDRARAAVHALGLDDRVRVHHALAARVAACDAR